MASGESESKHGTALTDKIREERHKLQEESRDAIRRLRDSIDLEDDRAPRVVVNVSRSKSLIDSLRPRRSTSTTPPSPEEISRLKRKAAKLAASVFAVIAGVIAALKAIGIIK